MYQELGRVALGTGEEVTAGVVIGPDLEWAERIEQLLEHKGGVWNWQNSQTLRSRLGIEARFYVLHREGTPFANISTFELAGVGHFSHVWTVPSDRRKGASSALMELQMQDFKARGGRALFLGTGFDSVPYQMYARYGFSAVEPQSGYMAWYASSRDAFESTYFAGAETLIEPLAWTHWPASAALFLGGDACVVRCAPMRLVGRVSTEGALLPLLRAADQERASGGQARAASLCNAQTSAVVGFAAWGWHPLWPDNCLLDVYCHPNYWAKAGDLLDALSLPDAGRYTAYCDAECERKTAALLGFGFRRTAMLKKWVPGAEAKTSYRDVAVFEKTP